MAASRSYWRSTRRLTLWGLLAWCAAALAMPLFAQPLEAISVMGIPLSFYALAHGLPVALVILAFLFASRQRRIDRALLNGAGGDAVLTPTRASGIGGITGALAMAGDWLSGATLVTVVGALFTLGHDGLYWLIGLVGGLALGGMLFGPHLHRAGGLGVAGFVRLRFGGVAGALSTLVIAGATALLLAANATALIAATETLLPDLPAAPLAALLVATIAFLMPVALKSRGGGITMAQAIGYPLLVAALCIPVVVTAAGLAPEQLAYGAVLKQIGASELGLLEKELADPVTLKLFTRPFTTATALSGLLLTLSLALGLAAIPQMLRRPSAVRSAESARLMPAAALLLILLAALALPPLVAKARIGVLGLAGERIDAPAPRLVEMGRLGLVDVCGARAPSAEAIAAACTGLPDAPAALRLDDVTVPRDRALLAAPLLAGQPLFASWVIAAALAMASLFASCWLGTQFAGAEAPTREGASPAGRVSGLVLAVLAASAAVGLVLTHTADVMTLLAWGLSLAAAGLAPILLAGIWSLRATAAGAVLGMVAGVGVVLYYVVGTRYFAPAFFELWGAFSSAGYGAIADYEAAKEALAKLGSQGDRQAAHAALDEAARAVANWWGMRDVASGALGAMVAIVVLGLVSLVTPRPNDEAISLISRIRGLAPRV
ncbi:MAG: DUF4212 domain-containing protein [Hyphomicrobiaceae bacterium]|nr:DUF4212 domain-containing protein [Hyphomicrobiaceae bacterium]